MSKTEFVQRAKYVLDLRQKALDVEIRVDEYTELIRIGKRGFYNSLSQDNVK